MLDEESRWQLVKLFLSVDSGSHFDLNTRTPASGMNFRHGQIKSYRLEPEATDTGCLAIDGEPYPSQRVQATMLDGGLLAFV